jgi:hypothetical protein
MKPRRKGDLAEGKGLIAVYVLKRKKYEKSQKKETDGGERAHGP